ncbi:MAG: hypothetical protein CBE26_04970 [Kiritimatiellaceae bacterium TMED266]|jgi:endo-1,4-beta-xylanase|nr:MAG: hypothetical protein CBE26_04970 [Kiritimatiellaceae bacterium TMED266]
MKQGLSMGILLTAGILTSCAEKGLHEYYEDAFLIGAAVGSENVDHAYKFPMRKRADEWNVLHREFNTLTAENLMKWMYMHPRPGLYNFEDADEFIDEAEANGHAVVGHALVWHAMIPDWVFEEKKGVPISANGLRHRMRDHIETIAGRYRGRIAYWDVVNEAVDLRQVKDENGASKEEAYLRPSKWLNILGEEYLELAFRFAAKADPSAKLLYNDYSMTSPAKAQFVADMCSRLRAKGVRVDGVGMQAHWHLEYPSTGELQKVLDIFRAAELSVHITELDLGVLPRSSTMQDADIHRNVELAAELNPYVKGAPEDVLEAQARRYAELFEVLYANRDIVERVTFWGLQDGDSWLNDWPVKGRTAHPLLFDRALQRKPAYGAILNVPNGNSTEQ